MSAFPINAALEGFRFTREHPRAIAVWGVLSFVAGLLGAAILIGSGAQEVISALPKPDPASSAWLEAYLAAIPKLLPGFAAKSLVDFIVFAVLACSAFRAILREGGAVRLAVGGDELRMALLLVTLGLINFGVVVVVSGLTGAATLLAGGPSSTGGQAVFSLGELASVAAQAVVMVRLALASPMSIAERRWSLSESWRRTRGRFWSMLGALIVAALLYLVVAFLVSQMFLRLGVIVHMAEGGRAPSAGLAQLADPAVLIIQAGLAFAFALGVPILAGPLAFAYRAFSRA